MAKAEILVVGDIHAMCPEIDVAGVIRFLEQNPAKTLVLAGDTLDFYVWRHSKWRVDVAAGVTLLEFLDGLACEIVILPGNHDLDWLWVAGMEQPPKRYKDSGRHGKVYPEGMLRLMKRLVGKDNVRVVHEYRHGDTLVVHGHAGWQGDWLWRASETVDRAVGYRSVGGAVRRKVMGNAPNVFRAAAVRGHGFYGRLARWARNRGVKHIIHGHTHVDGRRVRMGVTMDCLHAWRPGEGDGGGLALVKGVWEVRRPGNTPGIPAR